MEGKDAQGIGEAAELWAAPGSLPARDQARGFHPLSGQVAIEALGPKEGEDHAPESHLIAVDEHSLFPLVEDGAVVGYVELREN